MGRLYPTRLLVPAVWVKHQPYLRGWVRADWHRPGLQVQWRWPWESAKAGR